jgi:hypothetical protein
MLPQSRQICLHLRQTRFSEPHTSQVSMASKLCAAGARVKGETETAHESGGSRAPFASAERRSGVSSR